MKHLRDMGLPGLSLQRIPNSFPLQYFPIKQAGTMKHIVYLRKGES